MKEFDLESYQRKFYRTLSVLKLAGGKLVARYVRDIAINEEGQAMFQLDADYVRAEPEYFRFEPRIYKIGGSYLTIKRKLRKSYKIGLCEENHDFIILAGRPNWVNINPFDPLVLDIPKALKMAGPISDRLFITPSDVLYQGTPVGLRKGARFFVHPAIEQEVKDALRGHECKISS
jgi:hypothetical protein